MAHLILQDFKAFMEQSYETVSLGIKPSGRPHIGSIATFAAAFEYAAQHPTTRINIQIMDLDFDSRRGTNFTPFIHQQEADTSAREALRRDLKETIKILSSTYGAAIEPRVQVTYFSEFLLMPDTLDRFTEVFSDQATTQAINQALFGSRLQSQVPFSGICPNCHTSTQKFATRTIEPGTIEKLRTRLKSAQGNELHLAPEYQERKIRDLEIRIAEQSAKLTSIETNHGGGPKYFLRSPCTNDECPVAEYDFDMRHGNFNIHYLVDPMRDELLLGSGELVHVFGGDYGQPHGEKHMPKAEKIRNALSVTGPMKQDFFIGLMVRHGGTKMGKSSTSVAFHDLTPKNQQRVLEYIHDSYAIGSRGIDFEQMQKRLG